MSTKIANFYNMDRGLKNGKTAYKNGAGKKWRQTLMVTRSIQTVYYEKADKASKKLSVGKITKKTSNDSLI
jgi:hypothetical protein